MSFVPSRKFILWLVVPILLAVLAVGGGYGWLQYYLQSPSPFIDNRTVLIEPGSGSAAIAGQLAQAGVVKHPLALRIAAMLQQKHRRFQAGEYEFEAGVTPQAVINKLASGEVVKHKLTIPEGKSSVEIAELLNAEPRLSEPIRQAPAEGRLLPETYFFTRNESRSAIIQRMAAAQDELLARLWPTRKEGLPVKSPAEAVILASIVEKETGLAEERRRVAAVYINRLNRGMKLQADPTVAYGLYQGKPDSPALTYADLKAENPYNTYVNTGLPPGPICHPGAESIAAVLNPLKSKELYFVARGDGGHLFATTYTEHLKNVAKYRQWQRAQRR